MKLLSHRTAGLSIAVALPAAVLGLLAATALAPTPAAAAGPSPYYGRWTVNDTDTTFSAKGVAYKTIDIAPCGKDFCGVSVATNGACGPTLFRFLAKHAGGKAMLKGHAKWGSVQKNLTIDTFEDDSFPGKRGFDLNLGDGYSFNERDGNIPKFYGTYKRVGASRCSAR